MFLGAGQLGRGIGGVVKGFGRTTLPSSLRVDSIPVHDLNRSRSQGRNGQEEDG